MQLSEIVQSHIAQSLTELRLGGSRDCWENGERAKEEAEKIIAAIVAEKIKALETKK